MKDLKIIYKHNKPYGIRDETGYLFFFVTLAKYSGQEERYREEVEEQYKLADFLLKSLTNYTGDLNQEQIDSINDWRDEAGAVISACKTKLQLYRENLGGEYLGGVEYSQLMDMIDNFFNAPKSELESEK